jgi:hypothetical protein
VLAGFGANELGPLGFRFFWVGDAGGGDAGRGDAGGGTVAGAEVVVVAVVVVVVVVGLFVPLLPHAAVSPPVAMIATTPA